MTPRLTAPQMAVLRALDKLPEGEFVSARAGGFNGNAAGWLAAPVPWVEPALRLIEKRRYDRAYRLLPAGRSLIAKLKAEGSW